MSESQTPQGKHSCRCSRAVSDVPIDQRDHHRNQVAAHMKPGVGDVAYARFSKKSVNPKTAAARAIMIPAPSSHMDAVAQTAVLLAQ
jgi:hypothetical protein